MTEFFQYIDNMDQLNFALVIGALAMILILVCRWLDRLDSKSSKRGRP